MAKQARSEFRKGRLGLFFLGPWMPGDDAVTGAPLFLSIDQRGDLRRQGAHVDIGSFEARSSGVAVIDTEVPSEGTTQIPLDILADVFGGFFAAQNLRSLAISQAPEAPGVPGAGLGAYLFELRYDPAARLKFSGRP